jgi:broad specificity phosphatase PhoE
VRDLYQRAAAFCDDMAASLGGGSGDVLVIAHGGTVRVLDAYLHGVPVDQMTWRPVDNATIVRIPEFGTLSRGGNR